MNKVILGGRIGWIKSETTSGGTQICRTSLAEDVSRKGEKTTQWHKVSGFNKVAEHLESKFNQGDYLAVEGRLEHSSWDSNGETRYKTEVVIDKIIWDACRTDSGKSSQASNDQSQHSNNHVNGSDAGGPVYSAEDFNDDVPL
jgi:single-strand DNA-binding protein